MGPDTGARGYVSTPWQSTTVERLLSWSDRGTSERVWELNAYWLLFRDLSYLKLELELEPSLTVEALGKAPPVPA
jgi:hypothetical protein